MMDGLCEGLAVRHPLEEGVFGRGGFYLIMESGQFLAVLGRKTFS